jgi:diguanylate cyclase (GGDEF)-like protein
MRPEELEQISYDDELILVVDDEEPVRSTVTELLRYLGFGAQPAASGEEAVEKLKREAYTFLLTDIRMPGMDGIELIRRVKKEIPDLCCIAMTGYTQNYTYVDVINAGASDFIKKPVAIEELEAKIRRTIIERNVRNELNRMSFTDSLTGLFNHRHFFVRLQEEVKRAVRQNTDLALIMLDLDDFKVYNDRYGHLAGDNVLKNVGNIIQSVIREGVDSGYRYGGDEFAVILIEADDQAAAAIAGRIKESIKEECGLSASCGWARLEEGMAAQNLVSAADTELYRYKGETKTESAGH